MKWKMTVELMVRNNFWCKDSWFVRQFFGKSALSALRFFRTLKGSFTYYVITKGGVRNDYANVIFALSNAEFDYGRGEGV